jgi:N-acyl-D-amino-acid deacylase
MVVILDRGWFESCPSSPGRSSFADDPDARSMSHDLVIRGGRVADGSGSPSFEADVAVDDGRITAIGSVDDRGREEIDAEGHVVTPGFVDGHTHLDAQVMWDPLGTSSCYHGVTTVVMGNCGFTLAPARPNERELVVRNLERAEDISPAALAAGLDWDWQTFAEYLDAVERRPKGINFAAQIGHSALRTWAMGQRAFEEEASAADLAVMRRELLDAMEAGAVGFTTSCIDQHETSDDRPVASRLASWGEVCELVGVLHDFGVGVFEIAPGYNDRGIDDATRARRMQDLHDLAVGSGVPTTFGVGLGRQPVLDMIDRIAADGGTVFGQTHCRGIRVLLSFLARMPFDVLPGWKPVRALPSAEQLQALRDPQCRAALVDEANHADYGRAIGAEAPAPDWSRMRVHDDPVLPNPTIAELASARGADPIDVVIDLAIDSDLHQFFTQGLYDAPDDAILTSLQHPNTVMTFSDSGAHVSQISDCSIQTHLLAYWVREKQAFTFEEAVRMLSHEPARRWAFTDRGLVREGFVADLNVIDPARVAPIMPTVEHDLPAAARRLVQRSTGIRATVVHGEPVLCDGEPTGRLGGQLLRNGRHAPVHGSAASQSA